MQPFPSKAIPYLFRYAKMYKSYMLISFLLILMDTGVANLGNWFFAQIIEAVKNGISEQSMLMALKFVALIAVCSIYNLFVPRFTNLYRQKNVYLPMGAKISKDALAYIQGHSYNYISSNQVGTFANKLDQILAIQPILSLILAGSWTIICEIIVKTTILMIINVWLGLLFISCAILSYIFNVLINKKAERLHSMNNRIESIYSGWLVDVISNMRFVKQFGRLNFEQNRLFTILKQHFNIKKRELGEGLRTYTYVGIFINICSMIIITFAVYLWSKGKIGVGDIVFVLLTITSGLNYLNELHDIIRHLRNSFSAMDEGLKPFAVPHEIVDIPDAKKLKISKGEIEFKNIAFAYKQSKTVFNNFSLKISKKEKIGIVGLSGSGKTTLINLLQRAYALTAGQIIIDGQDISKITQSSLHEAISLIPQETTLFHRTIKENIVFGNPQAKEASIISASKKAYADEFIRCLPNGYETQVGDRGCKLSGGEKQRIAISRAIIKNSPILILDEATSALDSESEYLISQAISKIIKGKTVLAIAHRLSTLKEMDRIIVLDNGVIVEEGTYSELSNKKGGKFNHFCKLQKMKIKKEVN